MVRALIKKQLKEMLSVFLKKNGNKKMSAATAIFYAAILIYCVGALFVFSYFLMDQMSPILLIDDMGWLYFTMAGMGSIVMAVVGSVFMTQFQMYDAKDNEFLLSMPISPAKILFGRMMSLYIQNMFFELMVFLPTIIVYFRTVNASVLSILFCAMLIFILPLLSLALSCMLGGIVAFISAHMRNKSAVTMVSSLGFLFLYFYFVSQFNKGIQNIVANSLKIGEKIKGSVYPLYQMGQGALGDAGGFLIFSGIVIVLFAIVYFVLSKSFIKIATTKKGEKKVLYKEKALEVSSVDKALYRKEISHFLKSPIYMLNCGLGSIFFIIIAVALLVKDDMVLQFTEMIPQAEQILPIAACAMLCMMSTLNAVTAPSISLEGKNLWILQSLPVAAWKVLCAKIKLHVIITAPAAAFCSIAMVIVLKPSLFMSVMMVITPLTFIFLSGVMGLIFNLKFPKLDWSSEAVAVKQSVSALLAIFGGWGIVAALGIIYYEIKDYVAMDIYAVICTVIMAVALMILVPWLKKKGTKIFETL